MLIDLRMVETFPDIKICTSKGLSRFCTVFFQTDLIISLKYLSVPEAFQRSHLSADSTAFPCFKPDFRFRFLHVQPSHLHLKCFCRLENIRIIPFLKAFYAPCADPARWFFSCIQECNLIFSRPLCETPVFIRELPVGIL